MARPRLPDSELHEEVLKIRLTQKQVEDLKRLAAARDIPVAVLGRSLMMAAIGEHLRQNKAA